MHRLLTELSQSSKPRHLALKELESNFIRLDKYGHTLVVKFHNPSVRDFLINFIRENEKYIHDLVISATFFDQIVRLWGSTKEFEDIANFRRALSDMGEELCKSVQRLLHSKDCRLIDRSYSGASLIEKALYPMPIETRSVYALNIARETRQVSLTEFIFDSLNDHLSRKVHKFGLKFLLEEITKNEIVPSPKFLKLSEMRLLTNLEDFEDYEIALYFAGNFPINVSEDRLREVRDHFKESFADFVDDILVNSDDDPEALDRFADRLVAIGNKLDVDVSYEYDVLSDQINELARAIDYAEGDNNELWRDESGGSGATDADAEIHSMFEGLG